MGINVPETKMKDYMAPEIWKGKSTKRYETSTSMPHDPFASRTTTYKMQLNFIFRLLFVIRQKTDSNVLFGRSKMPVRWQNIEVDF